MSLVDTYASVRPSVVAFGSRFLVTRANSAPVFPTIIGTGFVVDERGLVVTNRHVIEALLRLTPHPETGASSAFAMVSSQLQTIADAVGLPLAFIDIRSYWPLTDFWCSDQYFGETVPDIGFVQIGVKGLSSLRLATEPHTWQIGMSVAMAGFPQGTNALTVYGRVNQITPILRQGIISSLYPFPVPFPHGFTIDAMIQSGASGSPVFLTDSPTVVGILHAILPEHVRYGNTTTNLTVDTNLTIGIPSHIIARSLVSLLENVQFDFGAVPTLASVLENVPPNTELSWDSFTRGENSLIRRTSR